MFKPGDKYIHFTRFGGINTGEVEYYNESFVVDHILGVHYAYPYIKTVSGVVLHLDGSDGKIYRIDKHMTREEVESWKKLENTDPKTFLRGKNGIITKQELYGTKN